MPVATLTFKLPEESIEHKFAINGQKYYCVIETTLEHIRQQLKHGDITAHQQLVLEEIRDLINGELGDL